MSIIIFQGVDPDLKPIEDAAELGVDRTVVHGTFSKFWPLIKQSGLSRMKRNHIHFAKG
jgi:2'-phosphotransferase